MGHLVPSGGRSAFLRARAPPAAGGPAVAATGARRFGCEPVGPWVSGSGLAARLCRGRRRDCESAASRQAAGFRRSAATAFALVWRGEAGCVSVYTESL